MLRRATVLLTGAALVVLAGCGDDESSEPRPTLIPEVSVTAPTETTAPAATTPPDQGTTAPPPTTEPVPAVTPPAGQPEACTVLAEAAFSGADLVPGALAPSDDPSGQPAPSTGCRHEPSGIALALYYGQDPLETLALVRVQDPGGSDVAGVGQDAYVVGDTVYVDAGSRAFAVTDPAADGAQLEGLARAVLDAL